MAAGDVVYFDQYLVDVRKKVHNEDADTIKYALITNVVTPSATTADPRWGAGGSTNLSANQVTPGGNYTTGGSAPGTNAITAAGGAAVYDDGDVSIAQHASNPTNARWLIAYNDTDAGKRAIFFVDLGAVIDLSAGAFSVTWNASGISSLDQAA